MNKLREETERGRVEGGEKQNKIGSAVLTKVNIITIYVRDK
jgi:hypothetical protein